MSGDDKPAAAAAAAADAAPAADEKAPAAAAAAAAAAAESDGGAPAAAASGDADGDDGAVVKKKRNRLKTMDDDEPPATAAATAAPTAVAPAAAAASSSSAGDLETQFRAAIEKYLETANVESTTLGDVRKHLKSLMPSEVVSANKGLVNKLMEQIMIAKLQANVISSGADASEIASAAAAASAAADAAASQPAEDEPEPSDDDDGADASAGSDEDYESGKKSKKKDKKERKSGKKKLRKAADSDDEGSKKRSGAKRKKGNGPEPPKKPKSAFIFFSTANRKKAKEDHEGASFGQLGKILGDRWKVLSGAEKAAFEDQATEDKRRYEKEMDEFKLANPDYEGPSRKSRKRNDDDDVTGGFLEDIGGSSGAGGGSSKSSGRSSSITKPPGPDASFYDHVLFQLKLQKRKKKDKHTDDEVKDFAAKLVAKMDAAYDDDTSSVKAGQPGLKKLQLLPEVTANVSKVMLEEALRDKGILRSFTKWLTPLSDGSLPNLKMRTELYMLLGKLKVEESDLANSDGLGKLMMRLWDHKQETVANKKQLQSLIEKWTRPIFGATVDYKKLAEVERKKAKEIIARKQSLGYKPVIPAPAVTKRAIIPDAATFDYALRPDSMLDEEEAEERAPKKDNESKHARLAKKIDPRTLGRTKSMRQATVDVTGNHINA